MPAAGYSSHDSLDSKTFTQDKGYSLELRKAVALPLVMGKKI